MIIFHSSIDKDFSDSVDSLLNYSMTKTCDEFYSEVQYLVTQKESLKDIDNKILSHDSFNNYKQQHEQFIERTKMNANYFEKDQNDKIHKKRFKKVNHNGKPSKLLPLLSKFSNDFDDFKSERSIETTENISFPPILSMSVISSLESISSNEPLISPRTKYISGCIRDGLKPFPNLILRRNIVNNINLSHYLMGDKMGKVLAECLEDLPFVESIDLNDNNLTDESLKHLLAALVNIQSLHTLDLSRNKIDGESSDALAEYVSRADCPLKVLKLQCADVDDEECDGFVQCLTTNKVSYIVIVLNLKLTISQVLLELDMSYNLLGNAEIKASNDPKYITGYIFRSMNFKLIF
jgi:hypothetical protein